MALATGAAAAGVAVGWREAGTYITVILFVVKLVTANGANGGGSWRRA